MTERERTMSSNKIFDGKILKLRVDTVEMDGQKYTKREIVERGPSVAVVAVTEDDELLLVKQFRKAVDKELIELPAGMIDFEEEPVKAAIRELEEETGYIAKSCDYILEMYSSPGFCDERIYIFFADGLMIGEQNFDEFESIEVLKVKFEEALKMIELGEIIDSKSITGILLYNQMRRKKWKKLLNI